MRSSTAVEDAAVVPDAVFPDSEESPSLRRSLRCSVVDGTSYGLMVGIGETYLQAFVLAIGLGEVFAGMIASVPLLAGSLLQLVSPTAIRMLRSHKRWIVICATIQACSFVPLIVAAILGEISPLWVLTVASVYWGASLATGPAWNTWMGTLVPRPLRARFFAMRTRLAQATTLMGFLIGGFALQAGQGHESKVLIFAALFTAACVSRVVSVIALATQAEPVPIPAGMRFLTLRQQWHRFTTASIGRLLVFIVAMQCGVYVAGPYFAPYMLREMEMSYTGFAILLGVSFVSKFFCLPFWGRVAHRAGAQRLLWIGSVGIIPLAAGWVVSDNFVWLICLQLVAGAAWGAYELAMMLMFFETIPEEERTSILTLYNVANATAIVLGSLIGAAVLKVVGVGVAGYMGVYIASTVLRAASLLLLRRVPSMTVTNAIMPLRTLAVRPMGTVDAPLLPAFPDQVDGRETAAVEPV
ncbi:MAG TPA: MFS transporter, partial [Planctomycetaceae bacterium]|nr:MFS transporter [Planctomycetaceae bacterium]